MKALAFGLTLMLLTPAIAQSAKKKAVAKKKETVKATPTPGPCLTPTIDPLKDIKKKEEPQGFSLQGGSSTGCKIQ